MKHAFQRFPIVCNCYLTLMLVLGILSPLSAEATAVSLATSPLATCHKTVLLLRN